MTNDQRMTNDEIRMTKECRMPKDESTREENLRIGEERMRQLAAQRGLDWDAMTDEDRILFVDDLIHEGRS
jgi:hypothetical protein